MATRQLTFDPENHHYFLGSARIPGVNEVLQDVGIINTDWYKAEHAERGKLVHELTVAMDRGEPTVDLEMPEWISWKGYLTAWQQAKSEYEWEFEGYEVQFHDNTTVLPFAGTLDRVTKDSVIDIKTGKYSPWHELQIAAYAVMSGLKYQYLVYLGSDGSYKVKGVDGDWDVFDAALRVWWYKHG
jgi:CRISPR/Cas system-associated exonuclease Cas4 (RecB family)|tara:strand:+ start:881 stop:1435 length:555 start_codon:yes stop_codon:yes gene_type:complete